MTCRAGFSFNLSRDGGGAAHSMIASRDRLPWLSWQWQAAFFASCNGHSSQACWMIWLRRKGQSFGHVF